MGMLGLLVVLVSLVPLALLRNTTAPRESLLISNLFFVSLCQVYFSLVDYVQISDLGPTN